MKSVFSASLLLASVLAIHDTEYSDEQAELHRQLASYAYCGVDMYLTQPYHGKAEGFVATSVIYQEFWQVQGYIGYLPSDESIFVVYEGT